MFLFVKLRRLIIKNEYELGFLSSSYNSLVINPTMLPIIVPIIALGR